MKFAQESFVFYDVNHKLKMVACDRYQYSFGSEMTGGGHQPAPELRR